MRGAYCDLLSDDREEIARTLKQVHKPCQSFKPLRDKEEQKQDQRIKGRGAM